MVNLAGCLQGLGLGWSRVLSRARCVQGVGDAISDLLFAEAVLFLSDMTVQGWDKLYCNMNSRQSVVKVGLEALSLDARVGISTPMSPHCQRD